MRLFLCLVFSLSLKAEPAIVIDHSPAAAGLYIGSPTIVILPDGEYLAAHDFFGPKSDEFATPNTVVFFSNDRGQNWEKRATLRSLFWAGLFVQNGAAYLMGTDRHHGRIVIRRSSDKGWHWSEAVDAEHGLLTDRAEYHTAPTPAIEHAGRVWRAFEDASGGTQWGARYIPLILSAPVGSDLLNRTNWAFSEAIRRDDSWFKAWLEGNAVPGQDGAVFNVLRVDVSTFPEKAAIISLQSDGRRVSFDPARDLVDFPGGAKKFTIRFDPRSAAYWTLANAVPKERAQGKPSGVRNTLALLRSKNLRDWEWRTTLLQHPDAKTHAFQYADWQFDGADIVAVVRTAADDDAGGAHNAHDANYMTFHRFTDFRTLTEPRP